ncbi:beta-ketoacyl synthase chain length factor [Fulvivirga sediminis]|uniref:Beta-ketoacyl synthase chain length factor n=1 Tax=Fulvivirga sediminis TaxID=2803949 RepID=A0A937F9M6_9BACT|nr:beta-ketoacyl synthase chain length factor [Fulvivirga sediminis]MBL3656835.1 beta-ketoacyl synthase chain length factor [Fulvivirga sediminis]
MKVYINSTSSISPQQSFDKEEYLKDWASHEGTYLKAQEPIYKDIINPRLLRRMSRIIKMGVATSLTALKEAGVEKPGAIIVGTGLGCIQDTEKFLSDIVTSEEGILSPTAFIQSTHNTVAGQIALLIGCNEDNFTYVNRGHSFENALMDGVLRIKEGSNNILVAGADEMTDEVAAIIKAMDYDQVDVWGEGASAFVLSVEGSETSVELVGTRSLNNLSEEEVSGEAIEFLSHHNLTSEDIDVVIVGMNKEEDSYIQAIKAVIPDTTLVNFKRVTGEFLTAVAFGYQLGVNALLTQSINDHLIIDKGEKTSFKKILVYNHYFGFNHSFGLLSK